ncbi:MAG: hypothetical protein JJ896_16295 [Rhodothermales bacterium]|nr:hypothetical protein [Rhodothermales bacterium]MBO6781217.1 hypothetical protein [Rhodothermales bacterium]
MKLPSHQANRIRGHAECVNGSITGEVQNFSDWCVTVLALEVHIDGYEDRPVRASEYVVRLPEPVPPGGSFVFSRPVSACSGSGRWTWRLARVYGFPKVHIPRVRESVPTEAA